MKFYRILIKKCIYVLLKSRYKENKVSLFVIITYFFLDSSTISERWLYWIKISCDIWRTLWILKFVPSIRSPDVALVDKYEHGFIFSFQLLIRFHFWCYTYVLLVTIHIWGETNSIRNQLRLLYDIAEKLNQPGFKGKHNVKSVKLSTTSQAAEIHYRN